MEVQEDGDRLRSCLLSTARFCQKSIFAVVNELKKFTQGVKIVMKQNEKFLNLVWSEKMDRHSIDHFPALSDQDNKLIQEARNLGWDSFYLSSEPTVTGVPRKDYDAKNTLRGAEEFFAKVARQGLSPEERTKSLKKFVLPKGTVLFHGTDSMVEFTKPNVPAWFAELDVYAQQWAGWGSVPQGGERRILSFVTNAPVALFDTSHIDDWLLLSTVLDTNDSTVGLARTLLEAGLPGWYGRAEVMLTDITILDYLGSDNVPADRLPFGRVG